MGKSTGKKKNSGAQFNGVDDANSRNSKSNEHNLGVLEEDTANYLGMARNMIEDGNKLFQKRDYKGSLLKYENAVRLLPKNHVDTACLHSNIAACYMQMGPDYDRAIDECNLALKASPRYTKALLKRARCYEALNRFDLACEDVTLVLESEPYNLTALEISERVSKAMEKNNVMVDDSAVLKIPDIGVVKESSKKKKKKKKKRSHKVEENVVLTEEKHIEVKEEPIKVVKLVLAEDIRWAQIPANCSISYLREIVHKKFPSLKTFLIKYRDKEGDLVTITAAKELGWAEESADPQGSVRLYLSEVTPEHEPSLEDTETSLRGQERIGNHSEELLSMGNDKEKISTTYIDEWVVQYAHLFKKHLGFSSHSSPDLHELGMELYSGAIEDTVTSEEAQEIFNLAESNFQQMAALALFNWGNVLLARARKKLFLAKDSSNGLVLEKVKDAYNWAQIEYIKAGNKYEEALKIRSDFYEGHIALGQQQFELARLTWYHALGSKVDFAVWPSAKLFELLKNSEDNVGQGLKMWEENPENQWPNKLTKPRGEKVLSEKMVLGGNFKELSISDATKLATNVKSQVNILWGTILYERSMVEFKLGIPIWEESLMKAVEKLKIAGVSPIEVIDFVKMHCANGIPHEGLAFMIDEIVQASNELYDAKMWMSSVSSLRLDPLFHQKVYLAPDHEKCMIINTSRSQTS
ncbi:protein PHOX1-like [Zingiber officinale]|uniref:protein PHOX1-like n=1 Tax=Zingiber officinale TaxID=94328 RepID=UPI001C4BAA57|nr:protein PHOX1-like [Zingiber officinale]